MEQEQKQYQDDEITLKDLIFKIKEYFYELLRNWLIIGLISIPFIAYFLFQHIRTEITYSSNLTFMVNEDDGNSVSSIGSILGQIGVGAASRRSRFNLDKILQLSRSRRIVGEAIFDSCSIDQKTDLLANHIITHYKLSEKWAENDELMKDFRFKHVDIPEFDLHEKKAFKSIVGLVLGRPDSGIKGLVSNGYNEETGIMKLSATTLNPEITFELLNRLFYHLSEYYIDKTTEKQLTTLNLVTHKRDSILNALQKSEYALATFRESNRNVIDSRLKLKETRLNRDVIVGTQAYAEAVKNVEISDFALKNMTPFIQSIDEPMYPISAKVPSLLLTLIKSILIGLFIGVFFVLGRKIYRDAMAED